jgi:hypothetical protein
MTSESRPFVANSQTFSFVSFHFLLTCVSARPDSRVLNATVLPCIIPCATGTIHLTSWFVLGGCAMRNTVAKMAAPIHDFLSFL